MPKLLERKKNRLLLITLFFLLLNLFLKSIAISSTPPLLTHDESYYAVEAQTIIAGLTDPTGTWKPWKLEPANPIYAELTGLVSAPGHLLFPHKPLLAAKCVPILMGSIVPLLLAGIVYQLTQKNKGNYYATLVVATLNPWLFQFSRMGFDVLYSLFFYTLAIFILISLRKYQRLWSILPLFLGFYQYQGGKLLLVPIVFLTLIYLVVRRSKKDKKLTSPSFLHPILGVALFALLLFIIHWIRLPHLSSSERLGELQPFDQAVLSGEVNRLRKASFANPITPLFVNKYTLATKEMSYRFLRSLDPIPLFFQGNKNIDTFAVTHYGFFHFADILLIAVGLHTLFKNKNTLSSALLLSAFLLVGTAPNLIKDQAIWATFRSFFSYATLIMLSGVGLAILAKLRPKSISFLAPLIYIILTIPFFFHYFYTYPTLSTKDTFFYDRVLASYTSRTNSGAVVISSSPKIHFDAILSYNQSINKSTLPQITKAYQTKRYGYANTAIQGNCQDVETDKTIIKDVIIGDCLIPDAKEPIRIASLIDSGTMFEIYNDTLCKEFELQRYTHLTSNKLNVKSLTDQEFCQTFFIR